MKRIIVEPGDTWVKLAYLYLGASSRFRDMLDANPQYHELSQPNVGDVINVPDIESDLTFLGRDLELPVDLVTTVEENIYPWVDVENYLRRLSQYHPLSLINIEDCNGDTLEPATPPYVPVEDNSSTDNTSVVNFSLL